MVNSSSCCFAWPRLVLYMPRYRDAVDLIILPFQSPFRYLRTLPRIRWNIDFADTEMAFFFGHCGVADCFRFPLPSSCTFLSRTCPLVRSIAFSININYEIVNRCFMFTSVQNGGSDSLFIINPILVSYISTPILHNSTVSLCHRAKSRPSERKPMSSLTSLAEAPGQR